MTYNPNNHHRRSLRLPGYDYTAAGAYLITICVHQRQCLFGEVVDGDMQLNALGQLVHSHWQRLPFHFPTLSLDAFVVMPNHVHGILVLTDSPGRGAALDQGSDNPTEDTGSNATPTPHPSAPGVALGQEIVNQPKEQSPNAAPLPPRLISGSVGAIVLNFKSITTRSRNRLQRSPGVPMWQRNYYDRIIRDDRALHPIRQYIQNNPLSWQADPLHPAVPSQG